MRLYEIEITNRYTVMAENEAQALASYRVSFEGIPPEALGLSVETVLDQDKFEYVDGSGRAVWAGAEIMPSSEAN